MIGRMFKCSEDSGIGLIAAANLGLSSVSAWLASLEPVLHVCVTLGQIAVALATVVYFYRKAKVIGQTKKDDE